MKNQNSHKRETIKVSSQMGPAKRPWDRVRQFQTENPSVAIVEAMGVIERLTKESVSSYKRNLDEALKMAESARKRYASATSERKEKRARKDWIAAMERAQEAADKINGVIRYGEAAALGTAALGTAAYIWWIIHRRNQNRVPMENMS